MKSRKMVLMSLSGGSRGDTEVQNRLVDTVRAAGGAVIRRKSTGRHTSPCGEQTASGNVLYNARKPNRCSSGALDTLEVGWGGGSRGRGHMYTYG